MCLRCDKEEAQGIMSSDGSTEYQLLGREKLGIECKFSADFISKKEYEDLLNECDEIEHDSVKEPTMDDISDGFIEETDEEETDEHIMTPADMRAAIFELQSLLKKEKDRNDMLEECILEMSEVIYA